MSIEILIFLILIYGPDGFRLLMKSLEEGLP